MQSESTLSGLPEIPGVVNNLPDPRVRERNRVYNDPIVDVPIIENKSKFNFLPMFYSALYYPMIKPIEYFQKFADTIRVKKPRRYYHHKYPRVPNIWECSVEDYVCVYEAEAQFRRDQKVDQEIIEVIKRRLTACQVQNQNVDMEKCKEIKMLDQQATHAWQVKYGDIGSALTARKVLQKQKNRYIEDRYLARVAGSS
ncbi:NADH dehydrogenase [ubiquinone] 1 beta subcomplex subunit 10-like [Ciona intestinalis]